jgi:hypothetical protein
MRILGNRPIFGLLEIALAFVVGAVLYYLAFPNEFEGLLWLLGVS